MADSVSFNEFKKTLECATSLMDIEKLHYGTPTKKTATSVTALRGGAIVLLLGAFESYLKSLCMEQVEVIGNSLAESQFPFLPETLIVQNVFETLKRAMEGPKYTNPRPPKIKRLSDIDTACATVISRKLNPPAFSETNSNPGSSTVNEMFKNMGYTDVLRRVKARFQKQRYWGAPVTDTFIADKLDEIVNHRNVVAHTANAMSISRQQMREYVRFLKALARVLDLEARNHVKQIGRKLPSP